MAQRFTRAIGKNLVRETLYPYISPSDNRKTRAAKSRDTRAAQRALNLDHSAVKLELAIDINFHPTDLFVTLTFRDDCLPKTREGVIKCARRFFDLMRKARKLRGDILKYIYCVEHGKGRWHIHCILNAVGLDYEQVLSLWKKWGDNVDFECIKDRGMEAIAHYMVKETDRPNSARAWIPSTNLKKAVYESYVVKKPVMLQTPEGCEQISGESRSDRWSGYSFIKYERPNNVDLSQVSGIGDLTSESIELLSRRLL